MNDLVRIENARRIEAWAWAAEVLGHEVGSERYAGLVELTLDVPTDLLKTAIKNVMRKHASGFLPEVALVVSEGKRLNGERKEANRERLRKIKHQRYLQSATTKPASPEEIQAMREKIERLANNAQVSASHGNGKVDWREELRKQDDSRGMAAVRKVVSERGRGGGHP